MALATIIMTWDIGIVIQRQEVTVDHNFTPEKAVRLAQAGLYSEALDIFEKNLMSTLKPGALSYYALCLAVEEEEYDRAVNMCLMAGEKEFYNPDIYLNLGRVLLKAGRKTRALNAFRKGLKFDEANEALRSEIRKLGLRREPIFSFLPRGNVLNKFCGLLACRVTGRGLARSS